MFILIFSYAVASIRKSSAVFSGRILVKGTVNMTSFVCRSLASAFQEPCGQSPAHSVQSRSDRSAQKPAILCHPCQQIHPDLPPPLCQAMPSV